MAEEKELRKMKRTELIEIIYALKKEEEDVNQKLEEAEQQLQDRTIQIAKAGSIAEAAMELNHVFASAQKAADEYLNSVHAANEEAEQYAKRIRKEAEEEALAIRAKTEEETELLRKQTEIAVHAEMEKMKMTCQEMLAAAVQKQKETGVTVILASHSMEDIRLLCDTVHRIQDASLIPCTTEFS